MSRISDILYYYFRITKHKIQVAFFIFGIILKLIKRAFLHDVSKYRFSETLAMSKVARQAEKTEYASNEYKACLESVKDAINLHYRRNRHHPEHHKNYKEMSLIDLLEMFCDWKSAVKNNINGDFEKNVAIQQKRFQMSDEIIMFLKTLK